MGESKKVKIAKEILRLRFGQLVVNEKYKAGQFKIPIHLAMGHEAIAVAVDLMMDEKDKLVLSHRNIHYNLARTGTLRPVLDEYLLKKEGLAYAELGSMNLASEEKGVIYASSILGNNLPVATGLALAEKVKRSGGLVIVVTGDGAIEEGAFYESLLFMKSNALGVLVIIENNRWSMHTKIEERRTEIDLPKLAASLGAGYEKLDGNDVYRYVEKLKEVKKKILEDKKPVVLEVNVTTLGGWYVEDKERKEKRFIHPHAGPLPEISLIEWPEIERSANDPVFALREHFSSDGLKKLSQEVLKSIKEEIGE